MDYLERTIVSFKAAGGPCRANEGLQGGGFGGARLCCAVTSAGLAWIEAAGFRALPPIEKPTLAITNYDATAEADMRAFMLDDPDSVALVSSAGL